MKLLIMVIFITSCFGANIEGFRDLQWGVNSLKLGNSKIMQKNESSKEFYKEKIKENLNIGNNQLEKIGYGFFDDKLFSITGFFKGSSNFDGLLNAFEAKYGEFSKENKFDNYDKTLSINDSFINIKYNKFSDKGHFIIMNMSIYNQLKEYKKQSDKNAVKDL